MATVPSITRRAAVIGALVSSAALAVPATASGRRSDLEALIQAHRDAYAAYAKALEAWDIASSANHGRPRILTPISVAADGTRVSGYYELETVPEPEIRKLIGQAHDQLRRVHCSKWTSSMVPEFFERMSAEISAAEQRAYDALDRNIAAMKAQRAADGVDAADEEVKRLSTVERKALAALLAYRPVSEEDRERKTDYITAHEDDTGVPVYDDEDMVSLLLDVLNTVPGRVA